MQKILLAKNTVCMSTPTTSPWLSLIILNAGEAKKTKKEAKNIAACHFLTLNPSFL
jgi:hypothetical protein